MPTTIQKRFIHELQAGTLPNANIQRALADAFRAQYSVDPALDVITQSVVGKRDQGSGFRRWQALVNIIFPTIFLEFDLAVSNVANNSGPHTIDIRVTTEDTTPTKVPVTVDVRDLLTGSAIPAPLANWDYRFLVNPLKIIIPAGTPHNTLIGFVVNVSIEQTVTVQFTGATTETPGDVAQTVNIPVSILTSNGGTLEVGVSVDVRDLLTGSAGNPADYTMTTPQTLTWASGEADGATKNAVLNTSGANNPDGTVDLDLDNALGATEGAQNTHEVTIKKLAAACADYSVVADTPNYTHPKLTETAASAVSGVVSGRFITTVDGEDSFFFKNSELDLNGLTALFVEALQVSQSTSSGKLVLFLSDSTTPGAVTVISAGTLTGYDLIMGSGTTAQLNRVIGGVRTLLGTFPFGSYALDDVRLEAQVNAGNVTFQAYKNGSPVGTPIVDSDPSRITNFRSAGKGMRHAFGQSVSMSQFCAGAV